MAIEKYIAAAALGLFIMFVGEILSLYYFLIEPQIPVEPEPKILQFISIGVAPAVILCGTSYIMSKRYGSKPIGIMIIAGGAILLGGMAVAHSMIDGIDSAYDLEFIPILTPLFMIVSIPVIVLGTRLLKVKKRKTKKDYF